MTTPSDTPISTRTVEIPDETGQAWPVAASVVTIAREERNDIFGRVVGLNAQLHLLLPGAPQPEVYFLSRLVGERHWAQDAHFGPEGQPYFVHGFGSRVTRKRGIHLALEAVLDDAAIQRDLVTDIGLDTPLVLAAEEAQ
ncbi:hypothetical protein [Actinokineospora iranica]|uniref:Uncharacterized protein n=1 Tax=Actinokineospora iranica TaxID=1271860 RepID=A0A1G6VS05_9PSEU|nr:hypothetical protein [Actinokineospora iranica]SDD55757.1 hypothetical protein SAMN05216174_11338 [Actinokineospora iranica]